MTVVFSLFLSLVATSNEGIIHEYKMCVDTMAAIAKGNPHKVLQGGEPNWMDVVHYLKLNREEFDRGNHFPTKFDVIHNYNGEIQGVNIPFKRPMTIGPAHVVAVFRAYESAEAEAARMEAQSAKEGHSRVGLPWGKSVAEWNHIGNYPLPHYLPYPRVGDVPLPIPTFKSLRLHSEMPHPRAAETLPYFLVAEHLMNSLLNTPILVPHTWIHGSEVPRLSNMAGKSLVRHLVLLRRTHEPAFDMLVDRIREKSHSGGIEGVVADFVLNEVKRETDGLDHPQ